MTRGGARCAGTGRRRGGPVRRALLSAAASLLLVARPTPRAGALSSPSSFHGAPLRARAPAPHPRPHLLVMRKQKASNKRTARRQRGRGDGDGDAAAAATMTSARASPAVLSASPLTRHRWRHKEIDRGASGAPGDGTDVAAAGGGRGRARKRLRLYDSLARYHSTFLELITEEYRMEEAEVITRLESSLANPFLLEKCGHALFDLLPQRRGNLFSDEVYRLEKSPDATTTFFAKRGKSGAASAAAAAKTAGKGGRGAPSPLPPHHKFSRNDVVVLTLQPRGAGDFLSPASLPTARDAVVVEARVLGTGPTYVDVAVPAGRFAAALGPAPNHRGAGGRGDAALRLRADRFFSDVPWRRMAAALGQLTAVAARQPREKGADDARAGGFEMDAVLKEMVLSTFAVGTGSPSLGDLPKKLAKPPLPTSHQLTNQVMAYIQTNPLFPKHNEPQLTVIRAALTRRCTLIQGPPGSGKTTTAGSIAFGFVHQCRSLSPHCKVLACAFSNVGADNLAERFLSLGLKVVRVGRPAGVSPALWHHTLDGNDSVNFRDRLVAMKQLIILSCFESHWSLFLSSPSAAIGRDPRAQKALEEAARVTAKIDRTVSGNGQGKGKAKNGGSPLAERAKRDAATAAVKASIQACNIAATRALREADVIVSTSIGAADGQLLASCGIYPEEEETVKASSRKAAVETRTRTQFGTVREFAPDNLPPLSTPFVIIDEACQSVEPASLIPMVSTNSCRSLVMLGDPCQLPPTVRSSPLVQSALSVSLMSRLASALPPPVTITAQKDTTQIETKFLQCKATREAVSKVADSTGDVTYRRQYSGSLLLSVQYRMHPSIAAFSSAVFYNGLLSSPRSLCGLRKFPHHLDSRYPSSNPDMSVRFVHVGGRNNESKGTANQSGDLPAASSLADPTNKSYRNFVEATQVVELVTTLLSQGESGSVGIVTPYSSQVALIKSMMANDQDFRTLAGSYPHDIEVKSVDAYQGRERDLIVFSAVRSNHRGRIGFLTDWRRMNVALTRAKNGLVVFGDADTLEGDTHWGAFVQWCKNMGCFVNASPLQ